jgi:hypothetical protein
MGLYKKIAILLIFLIFTYVLYRLLQKRFKIVSHDHQEGFTPADSNVLAIQKANTLNPTIQNVSKNYYSKPLNKFYIMAAYGGAFDGYDTCDDMMLYTLSLGYRYVCVHVFFDVVNNEKTATSSTSKTAMVGFSSIYSPMENIANKTIALSDLVELIQQNAFTSSSTPNTSDPFFLHILPAYQTGSKDNAAIAQGYNTQLNSQIEQALSLLQNTNRVSGPIQPNIPLGQIRGKIVVVMDSTSTAGNMTDNLKSMVSLNVPGSWIQTPDSLSSHPWNIVLPLDENNSVLNSIGPYKDIYESHKWNVSPICPWESRSIFTMSMLGPSNLGDYESLFYTAGSSAFIPLP